MEHGQKPATARVFFALLFNASVIKELERESRALEKSLDFKIRQPPPGSHHVTLCFIPAVRTGNFDDLAREVAAITPAGPLRYRLGILEPLNNRGQCRLFLRAVETDDLRVRALQSLIEKSIRQTCPDANLSLSRHYHVTMARVSGLVRTSFVRENLASLRKASNASQIEGSFEKFAMIRSELSQGGPVYTTLNEWCL